MRVDNLNWMIGVTEQLGRARNVSFVVRVQSRKSLSIQINNGRTEEIISGALEGIGVQIVTPEGFMGFAAADQLSESILKELFEKAFYLAEQSRTFGAETNLEIGKLQPTQGREETPLKYPLETLKLSEIEDRIKTLNDRLSGFDPRLAVRSQLQLVDEEWRIFRSDGTDVAFNQPRANIYHLITAKEGAETATTYANISGTDLGILLEEDSLNRLNQRAEKAARLSLALLKAGQLPAGHYKLVIDYALAKGLAHEAFGHAAETDGLESSILGENGRLKTGMIVANSKLSIIDTSLTADHAYQPFSAMGIKRETVTIVDHGRLAGGLADIFSAASAGVPPTGAERVESFFQLPIARMSNIRIEFEDPIVVGCKFEEITPETLYRILRENNLGGPTEEILYLSGFRGGQVNPAFGDFVFHCAGIYRLGPEPVLYKPAIFSGKILTVLKAVSAAIGPLQLDAIGTCGKMGQGVPSAGGAHYFLVIEANPEITIGGE